MCNVFGPAAGYVLGAVSLRYYVDFYRTEYVIKSIRDVYVIYLIIKHYPCDYARYQS